MPNIDHIMPNPQVVPIFWGHEYAANPITAGNLLKMISDVAAGPYMNALAQYGIQRARVITPIVIDDRNPPATLTYTDSNNRRVDEITKQLIRWIQVDKVVPAPVSADDVNQLYLIIPPIRTQILFFNSSGDPTGNGVQGFHSTDGIDPPPPPHFYWAIVKTGDALDPIFKGNLSNAEAKDGGLDFIGNVSGLPNGGVFGIAQKVAHELAEQFADRNGTFLEVVDDTTRNPCNENPGPYRGWIVSRILSVWDGGCSSGDAPVSMRKFLNAINFDFQKGLRSLGAGVIDIPFIAFTMRSQPTPDTSGL